MRNPSVLLLVLAPVWAHAEPSTTSIAEADTLFEQGHALIGAGKVAEACSAFDASQKKSPALSTLIRLADCREQNSQLATAYGLFREAERQTRESTDGKSQQLNRVAGNRARDLEPRLSKLTISVPANVRIDGLQIRRGNEVIDLGAWNRPLPVDGGTYQVTARAPARIEWKQIVTVAATKDTRTVDVPALVLAPIKGTTTTQRKLLVPLLIAGGAFALFGGALATDLSARSDYDKSSREADDARQASLYESAKTKRFAAQGFMVGGVGAAGVAIWLYLRGGSTTEAPSLARVSSFNLEPVVSTTSTGLQLTRRY